MLTPDERRYTGRSRCRAARWSSPHRQDRNSGLCVENIHGGKQVKPVLCRAIALLRTGDVEKAEALLEATLSSKRNDPELTNALGVLRAFSGRYDEARELFEVSLHTSRNKAKVLCNLGNLCLVENDPEGALRYYAQAMEASFMAPEPRYNAARAYQEMGQFEKALQAIFDYDDCRSFQRRLGIMTLLTVLLGIVYVAGVMFH